MLQIDARELATFSRALKQMEPEANKAMNRRINELAKPIAQDVKRAALAIPTTRTYTADGMRYMRKFGYANLRKGLADSVVVRNRTSGKQAGVRIVVSRSAFAAKTGKAASLPRYMEGLRRNPWRHPVFGNKDRWVVQKKHEFLLPTVLPQKRRVQRLIVNTYVETFRRELTKHGVRVD